MHIRKTGEADARKNTKGLNWKGQKKCFLGKNAAKPYTPTLERPLCKNLVTLGWFFEVSEWPSGAFYHTHTKSITLSWYNWVKTPSLTSTFPFIFLDEFAVLAPSCDNIWFLIKAECWQSQWYHWGQWCKGCHKKINI